MENDICKCTGVGCGLKERCYRFMVKADYRQAYFTAPPMKRKLCMYFIDNKLFCGLKEKGKVLSQKAHSISDKKSADKPYNSHWGEIVQGKKSIFAAKPKKAAKIHRCYKKCTKRVQSSDKCKATVDKTDRR